MLEAAASGTALAKPFRLRQKTSRVLHMEEEDDLGAAAPVRKPAGLAGMLGGGLANALTAAIDQANEDSPSKPSYTGWRAEIEAAFAANSEQHKVVAAIEKMINKLEKRHERNMEKVESRGKFKLAEQDKKMTMQRNATTQEAKNIVTKLKGEHLEAQAKLRQEMKEAQEAMERKLADQMEAAKAMENKLLQKLTVLDGGAAAAELERERYIEYVAKNAAKRMQNANLTRGWLSWRELCDEVQQMKYAATRMLKAGMSQSFNAWVEFGYVRAQQQLLLSKAATKLMKQELNAVYRHWRRDWEIGDVREEMEARIKELEDKLRHEREEHERELDRLTNGVSAAERALAAAKKAELERLARSAVRRMMNQQLSQGWTSWLVMWEEIVHWRQSVSGAALRIRNQQLSKGLGAWVAVWEEERSRKLFEVAVARLRNRELAMAFVAWAEGSENERLNKALAAAASRMYNRSLFEAWDAWAEVWQEEVDRRKMEAALLRMRNSALARAYGAWVEMKDERMWQMQALSAGMIKLRYPQLSASFSHWADDWREAERIKQLDRDSRPLPTWDEIEERERKLTDQVDDLKGELSAAKRAAENSEAVVHLQNTSIEKLTKEVGTLTLELQKRKGQVFEMRQECDAQLAKMSQELAKMRQEAKIKATEMASIQEQLVAYGTPLSDQERRKIWRQNLETMQAQLEKLSETATDNHHEQVRGLTNLIALRERQLVRVSSSPRLASPRARPASAHARPQLSGKPIQQKPPRASSSATIGVAGGLFVAPTFPEVAAKAGEHKLKQALKLEQAVQRATALWGSHEAGDVEQAVYGRLYGGAKMDRALIDTTLTPSSSVQPPASPGVGSFQGSPMPPRSAQSPQRTPLRASPFGQERWLTPSVSQPVIK